MIWRVLGATILTLGAWAVVAGVVGGLLDSDVILAAAVIPILAAVVVAIVAVAVISWIDVFRGRP